MKNISLIVSFFMFFIGCKVLIAEEIILEINQMKFNYLEISRNKIKELGLDAQSMECLDKTAQWRHYFKIKNNKEQFKDLYEQMADKDFVVIYCFSRKIDVMGGDVNIFIDSKTGDIVNVLRGQ